MVARLSSFADAKTKIADSGTDPETQPLQLRQEPTTGSHSLMFLSLMFGESGLKG